MVSWSQAWRSVLPGDVVRLVVNAASLFVVALLTLPACEEPKPAEVNACELLSEERAACHAPDKACEGERAECEAGCKLGLECEDLLDSSKEPGVIACVASCAPKFMCDDGSSIPENWKCDDNVDCPDGEDEAECQ